jgi:radical SAM superfamily enzyme YgiQ (UPF0313 family)
MNDLDFLFLWPTAKSGFARHLGASYIQAHLKAQGIRTAQFVHSGNATLDYLTDRILECRPKIFGFTCYDVDFPRVKVFAERIRRLSSGTAIVCGGPAAAFSDRIILENCPSIDCCVRYEGESAALELLEWVNGERLLESIQGISYRSGQMVCRNPDRDVACGLSESLDELTDPYLAGVIPASEAGKVGLITSRGCSFFCTYCSFRLMSRGRIRFHSVERVLTVLSFLDRELNGSKTKTLVPICDDNLAQDHGRFHLLLRKMAELELRNLRFNCMMRADLLTQESFSLLRDAGFDWVLFGVESAAPQILGTIKRVRPGGGEMDGFRLEREYLECISWAVSEAKRAGLGTIISIILGCPGENEKQGRETLDYVRRMGVNSYSHGLLKVYAGTELERTCEDAGIHVEQVRLTPMLTRTRLAYPAYRLPKLDNAIPYPAKTDAVMSLIMRLLTGAEETYSGLEVALSQASARGPVLGMSKLAPARAVCDWLNEKLPYSSVVCLIFDDPRPPENLQTAMREGFPFNVYGLRAVPHDAGGYLWRVNELEPDEPVENCMAVRFIPFAAVNWADLTGLVDPVRQTLMLTTGTIGDVEVMERVLAAGEPAGCWRFPLSALENSVSIADGCRWAGAPCPASKGFRWFIDGSGRLSPCWCGGLIGEVGQSSPELQKIVEHMERDEAEKRNCASCPVSIACSRCLFPGPLGTAHFCEFRKRHPNLPVLIDGLVLARILVQSKVALEDPSGFTIRALHGRLSGSVAFDGGQTPLSECLLLTFDGTNSGFLCHSRRKLLIPIEGEQLRAVEALLQAG